MIYNPLFSFMSKFEVLFYCLILQIMFSKKMCLEHDEKLISYLSMLRDIEMRIKRVQPVEQNLAALRDLLQQAEVSEAGPGSASIRQDRARSSSPQVHAQPLHLLPASGSQTGRFVSGLTGVYMQTPSLPALALPLAHLLLPA